MNEERGLVMRVWEGSPRRNASSAKQNRGQKVWSAIQGNISGDSIDMDTHHESIGLGVTTGHSGSGLCPTRDRPDQFEFQFFRPVTDQSENRIKSDRTVLAGKWSGLGRG